MKSTRVFYIVTLVLVVMITAVGVIALIRWLHSASDDEWRTWSIEIADETFTALQKQELISCESLSGTTLPTMTLVDGKPSLGNQKADEQFLDNTGKVTGKVALTFTIDPLFYYRYDPDTQWSLRDEV
ncbi:MAG: hypothetical protein LBK67_10895, partial [Coriobacteriales bacterium]|nr:hypothetical protein [Coriobacteriales bacterium]